MCADDVNSNRCEKLRLAIRQYFEQQPKLEAGKVTQLTFAQEDSQYLPPEVCILVSPLYILLLNELNNY